MRKGLDMDLVVLFRVECPKGDWYLPSIFKTLSSCCCLLGLSSVSSTPWVLSLWQSHPIGNPKELFLPPA